MICSHLYWAVTVEVLSNMACFNRTGLSCCDLLCHAASVWLVAFQRKARAQACVTLKQITCQFGIE